MKSKIEVQSYDDLADMLDQMLLESCSVGTQSLARTIQHCGERLRNPDVSFSSKGSREQVLRCCSGNCRRLYGKNEQIDWPTTARLIIMVPWMPSGSSAWAPYMKQPGETADYLNRLGEKVGVLNVSLSSSVGHLYEGWAFYRIL